jgi:hypothetical protein
MQNTEIFDSSPANFRGRKLPKNNRECVMLRVRLGTMRGKAILNLRDRQLTEKESQNVDDLIWDFVWYSWQEARLPHDHSIKEKT